MTHDIPTLIKAQSASCQYCWWGLRSFCVNGKKCPPSRRYEFFPELQSPLKQQATTAPAGDAPASATTGSTTAALRLISTSNAVSAPPTGVCFRPARCFFIPSTVVVWSKTVDAGSWDFNLTCITTQTRKQKHMGEKQNGSDSSSGGEVLLHPKNARERKLVAQVARTWRDLGFREGREQGRREGYSNGMTQARIEDKEELRGHRDAVSALHAKLTGVYAMVRGACEVMDAAGLGRR